MHLTQYDIGLGDDTPTVAGNPTNQDVILEVEQARIEIDLDRQIDDLAQATRDFLASHSSFTALWDKARGGPDLSPLLAVADDIQAQLDAAKSLGPSVRASVQKRLSSARAAIVAPDWRLAAITIVGLAALKWGFSFGLGHAKRHYQKRYGKSES